MDWEECEKELCFALGELPEPCVLATQEEFEQAVSGLTNAILRAIDKAVPIIKKCPYTKRWWNGDIARKRAEMRRAWRRAVRFRDDESHISCIHYRSARNTYAEAIEAAKKRHWEHWVEDMNSIDIWIANRLVTTPYGDGGKTKLPVLRGTQADGQTDLHISNGSKAAVLHKGFFPTAPDAAHQDWDGVYSDPKFPFEEIQDIEIMQAIHQLSPYKAPGASGIVNVLLKKFAGILVERLGHIYWATFSLRVYPDGWKKSISVVLRKPGKPDYTVPNAYRPVALLETLSKPLSKCIANVLSYYVEKLSLLPRNHFGGRPGRNVTNALHAIVGFVKDAWREGKVVSALFLDVKAAFPNVSIQHLIHNMRKKGVPIEYTEWLERKNSGQKTTLVFDDYVSEAFDLGHGLDQGCSLSALGYLFYNAPLLESVDEGKGEMAVGVIDDVVYLAKGDSFKEAHRKIRRMFMRQGGAKDWARDHCSEFEMSKLALVDFSHEKAHCSQTNKTIPLPRKELRLDGHTIKPSKSTRYLGVLLDQELRFKEHSSYSLSKGTQWALQSRRLSKPSYGLPHKFARQLYTSIAMPKMMYAVDVWCGPVWKECGAKRMVGSVGMVSKLSRVQRMSALHTTGALRTMATDALNAHADLLPTRLYINKACFRSTIRLASFPKAHPLHIQAQMAARGAKTHRSPMHNLFRVFGSLLRPSKVETLQIGRFHPAWQSPFRIEILPDSEEAIAWDRADVRGEKFYGDGSGYEGGIGAAAVMWAQGRQAKALSVKLGSEAEHTVYEAEVVGVILALHIVKQTPSVAQVVVCVDNQAAIRAIQGLESSPGHYLLDEVHRLAEEIKQARPGVEMCIRWMPGHHGVLGNEAADVLAKEAAEGRGSPKDFLPALLRKPLPISVSALNRAYGECLKKENRTMLRRSPRYNKMAKIDPSLPSSKFRKLVDGCNRRQQSVLVQLRTGHVPLQQHLHRIKRAPSPMCPACNRTEETVFHFLMACPAYEGARDRLRAGVGRSLFTVAKLLSEEKVVRKLLHYVDKTGRLKGEFGSLEE